MSRPFEASLANQLARLDHWIAESELMASCSTDEETLRKLDEDLTRWRESRNQSELRLVRTRLLNRFASRTLVTFWISFALLFAAPSFGVQNAYVFLFVAAVLLLLIGCGATYIVAIIVRDAVAQGRQFWRFSLRSLFVGTTVIAVVLALLAYLFRI